MRRYPKILLAAPQAESKMYCWQEWVENINRFTYPADRIDYFFADNSPTTDNAERIKQYGFQAAYVKPSSSLGDTLCRSHNLCREKALSGGYDFLLHLETDIFPSHPNFIEQLLSHKKSCIGANYNIFDGADRHPVIRLMADHMAYKRGYDLRGNIHHAVLDGTTKPVYQIGLGCVLIHTSVLRKVKFRFDESLGGFPDTYFGYDLYMEGIDLYCDFSIPLYHASGGKKQI